MKECWQEGDLRAYYDGELPAEEMARAAAHLSECPQCEALADQVAGRAARVAGLMAALPEPEQVMWMPRRASAPAVRSVARSVWVAAALAAAAGIAVAVWLAPRRVEVPTPPVRAVVAPRRVPAATPVRTPEPEVAEEPEPAPVVRTPLRRPRPQQMFFALDDEPIETGYVVRVALGAAEIPADVVIGADGRARAIRLVSNTSYK